MTHINLFSWVAVYIQSIMVLEISGHAGTTRSGTCCSMVTGRSLQWFVSCMSHMCDKVAPLLLSY